MAADSDYDKEAMDEHIKCASCGESKLQCYRVGCKYRLASHPACVDCCPCGVEQASELRTAAAKTPFRLGI